MLPDARADEVQTLTLAVAGPNAQAICSAKASIRFIGLDEEVGYVFDPTVFGRSTDLAHSPMRNW